MFIYLSYSILNLWWDLLTSLDRPLICNRRSSTAYPDICLNSHLLIIFSLEVAGTYSSVVHVHHTNACIKVLLAILHKVTIYIKYLWTDIFHTLDAIWALSFPLSRVPHAGLDSCVFFGTLLDQRFWFCIEGEGIEDALHLAANEQEAVQLAISCAATTTAEKRKLRAEEDVFRRKWEYQEKLKNIFKIAAVQEQTRGSPPFPWAYTMLWNYNIWQDHRLQCLSMAFYLEYRMPIEKCLSQFKGLGADKINR